MTATSSDATDATPRARLRLDVLDRETERLGATGDGERAKLIGVDRVTMWRYRKGRLNPSLSRAMDIARRLGIDVNDLIEEPAA